MYLFLGIISLVALFLVDWRIALPISVLVICIDRVMDDYRRELEEKKKDK